MGHTGRYIWALAAAPAPSEIAQVLDHCRLAFALQADDAASCGCAVNSSIMELLYHTRCACTTRRHQRTSSASRADRGLHNAICNARQRMEGTARHGNGRSSAVFAP